MIKAYSSTRRFFALSILAVPLLLTLSLGNSSPPSDELLHTGPEVAVGNGTAWSWVRAGSDGTPTAIGISFTESALQGLPDALPGTEFTLALPTDAQVAPFDHISLDWNPMGHEPDGIYTTPHFDVHFYMISDAERDSITFGPDSLTAAPEYLPADHMTDGISLPRMGVHWVRASSHEFHGQPFTETFLYGYSRGKLIFLEPMITKAFFESKENLTKELTLPAKVERPGYYPTRYSISYDAPSGTHSISLEGLVYRAS